MFRKFAKVSAVICLLIADVMGILALTGWLKGLERNSETKLSSEVLDYASSSDSKGSEYPKFKFELPNFIKPSQVFVHKDGFEFGKERVVHQPDSEQFQYDGAKRVESVNFNILPGSPMPYADNSSPFVNVRFRNNGYAFKVASQTWLENFKPLTDAVTRFVNMSKQPVCVVLTFEYSGKSDTIPEYFTFKAFSKRDFGSSLSVQVTFHQFVDGKALDFVHGSFMSQGKASNNG